MTRVSAARVERWYGQPFCELIQRGMHGWYGNAIPVADAIGNLSIDKDGEFSGSLKCGEFASLQDYINEKRFRRRVARMALRTKQYGGFASYEIARSFTGQQRLLTAKTSTNTSNAWTSEWIVGTVPTAGAIGSAAPGGRACTSATVGAIPYVNPTTGTAHVIGVEESSSSGATPTSFLIYDRIFDVAKTMNSTATEAVTGVPTRYQNTDQGSIDSAENNFCFPETITVLPATAHNWTVCQYTNQAGTVTRSFPSAAGVSAAAAGRIDLSTGQWFMPLQSGDTGVQALTQMQCDALVATGTLDFVIGHALAWASMAVSFAGYLYRDERLNVSPILSRVFDNACLSRLVVAFGSTTNLAVINIGSA